MFARLLVLADKLSQESGSSVDIDLRDLLPGLILKPWGSSEEDNLIIMLRVDLKQPYCPFTK